MDPMLILKTNLASVLTCTVNLHGLNWLSLPTVQMRRLGKQTHEDPLQWLRNDVFTSSGGLLNKHKKSMKLGKGAILQSIHFQATNVKSHSFFPRTPCVTKRFKIKDFKERGAAGKYQTHFWGVNIQKKCPAKKSHWKSDSMKRKK